MRRERRRACNRWLRGVGQPPIAREQLGAGGLRLLQQLPAGDDPAAHALWRDPQCGSDGACGQSIVCHREVADQLAGRHRDRALTAAGEFGRGNPAGRADPGAQ
jgi:hypothetical protein